jgi:hypothetical protein
MFEQRKVVIEGGMIIFLYVPDRENPRRFPCTWLTNR